MELEGVAETLLWTLYHRALEAARADAVLHDPLAVELVEALDYPFAERFGPGHPALAQAQALRALRFDRTVRRFMAERPGGAVVALGEGLETQFWRVDDGRVAWLSVELPEVVELRRRLLPPSPRLREVARSALDLAWMDEVDASRGVLFTAQGLLMYLRPPEVKGLIAALAERFPGGALLFDAVPRWFSARTLAGRMTTREGYSPPPMPWGLDVNQQRGILSAHPNVVDVRDLPLPRGRGLVHGWLTPLLARLPLIGDRRLSVALARFGSGAPA